MIPGKPETQDPSKDENLDTTTTGEAVVELDATTGKPVEITKSAEPSISPDELKKMQARIEYQARQLERQQREFEERVRQSNQKFSQPAQQIAEKPIERDSEFDEELHQIAQVNYQKAIRIQAQREAEKIAEKKFKQLLEERDRQTQAQNEQIHRTRSLEQSKARVLEEYPSLNDETSDEFKTYYQVYNEELARDPYLAQNPNAPELIMFKMERRLKAKPANPALQAEQERLLRVQSVSSPQGRPVHSQKTIQLTQKEIDFCTSKGISPQTFAQMKDANLKEGVSA